jgi:hypothetical protein
VPPAIWTALQPLVQRTEPARDTGEPCGMTRLSLSPVFENSGLRRFRPWTGWQIVGLLLDRTGQKPLSLFFHDFTAWFSHDFRMVALEGPPGSALRFQFHQGLQ